MDDINEVSCAARRRWAQMGLTARALRFCLAVDDFLGGWDKTEDTISNDQLMAATGFRWKSDLMAARKDAVEAGAVVFTPTEGGMDENRMSRISRYAYAPEDVEEGARAHGSARSSVSRPRMVPHGRLGADIPKAKTNDRVILRPDGDADANGSAVASTPRRPGRRRIYATNAERQAAYRKRKAQRERAQHDAAAAVEERNE